MKPNNAARISDQPFKGDTNYRVDFTKHKLPGEQPCVTNDPFNSRSFFYREIYEGKTEVPPQWRGSRRPHHPQEGLRGEGRTQSR